MRLDELRVGMVVRVNEHYPSRGSQDYGGRITEMNRRREWPVAVQVYGLGCAQVHRYAPDELDLATEDDLEHWETLDALG